MLVENHAQPRQVVIAIFIEHWIRQVSLVSPITRVSSGASRTTLILTDWTGLASYTYQALLRALECPKPSAVTTGDAVVHARCQCGTSEAITLWCTLLVATNRIVTVPRTKSRRIRGIRRDESVPEIALTIKNRMSGVT